MLEWEILVAAVAVAAVQETFVGLLVAVPAVVAKAVKDAPEVQGHPQAAPVTRVMQVHQALHRPRLVLLFPAEAGATAAPQAPQAPEAMAVVARIATLALVLSVALAEVMGAVTADGVVQRAAR
jgi:hypothetical protein